MAGYPRRGAVAAFPHEQGLTETSDASLSLRRGVRTRGEAVRGPARAGLPGSWSFWCKASFARAYLPEDHDEVLVESDIPDLQP